MNSMYFLSLCIVVLAQLVVMGSANDPLLAEAHGLGLDLNEHIATLAKEEQMLKNTDIDTTTVTTEPTLAPTANPTANPTVNPTETPTDTPTESPTAAPVISVAPTMAPTIAPTMAPTRAPTAASSFFPTAAPSIGSTPVISFASAMAIGGLSTSTLDTASKKSVAQATCTTMGLSNSSCSFWGSTSFQTGRRMLREVHLEATYTITAYINTTVSVPAGTTATAYFSSLSILLSDKTTLTANIIAAAVVNGASATLGTANVLSVNSTLTSVTNPPSSTSSSDDDELSAGAIAGIVIGSVVGFALISFIIYYFCFREGASGMSEGDSNFNARHHRNSKELPISL